MLFVTHAHIQICQGAVMTSIIILRVHSLVSFNQSISISPIECHKNNNNNNNNKTPSLLVPHNLAAIVCLECFVGKLVNVIKQSASFHSVLVLFVSMNAFGPTWLTAVGVEPRLNNICLKSPLFLR